MSKKQKKIKQNELDTRKIKGVFNYYDYDKESALKEELVYQALRACDVACFDADIAKKLTKYKSEIGSGGVNFELFYKIYKELNTENPIDIADLTEAFMYYDPEGQGVISLERLKDSLENIGEQMKTNEIDDFVAYVDPGESGFFNWKNFVEELEKK